MVKLDEASIVEKGRVGPGQMIGVDLDAAALLPRRRDEGSARRAPALTANGPSASARSTASSRPMRPSRCCYGTARSCAAASSPSASRWRSWRLILQPMVEDAPGGRSAAWATTRRSPCCPTSYRGLHHYFRQNFSQVTNPPIDSLRETPRDDAEDAARQSRQHARRGRAASATCCSSKARCCPTPNSRRCARTWATPRCVVDCTFPVADGEAGLRAALDRIRREAEEGVRAGCTHVILTDEAIGPNARADPDDPRHRRACTPIWCARACAPSPA